MKLNDNCIINLIFRSKLRNEYSIEGIFEGLNKCYVQQGIKTEVSFLPDEKYNNIKSFFKNIKFLKKLSSDVYHITGEVTFAAMFLPKKKTIITVHDLNILQNDYSRGIRRFLFWLLWFYIPIKRVKYVTCISDKTKSDLIKLLPQFSYKYIVINNPYSSRFCTRKKNPNLKCPQILAVGTRANKNLERIIEAIRNMNCRLSIIGKLSPFQIQMLRDYNIEYENAYNISDQEVVDKYVEADIVCFPSTYEGFGMPIIEAQAVGRPIITSNISPMKEIAGDSAILVNPYEVGEISDAIKLVLSSRELYDQYVEKGLINIRRFTQEEIARQYIGIYNRVLTD